MVLANTPNEEKEIREALDAADANKDAEAAARSNEATRILSETAARIHRAVGLEAPSEVLALLRAGIFTSLTYKRSVEPAALARSIAEFGDPPETMLHFARCEEESHRADYVILSDRTLGPASLATRFLLRATVLAEGGRELLLDPGVMLQRLLNRGGEERPASFNRLLRALADEPPGVPVHTWPDPDAVLRLHEQFPNFSAVIDFYAGQLALRASAGADAPAFVPVLLVGPPGVGKTSFSSALANVLGAAHHLVPIGAQSAGFVLGGLDSGWSNAKPGRIFSALTQSGTRPPLVVLDEIDKASGDRNHDPLGPLYGLLEPETARRYADEFFDVPMDASAILWVATANDMSAVPEAIQSRFLAFEIAPPDAGQLGAIADRMVATFSGTLRVTLSPEARTRLVRGSVRDLKLALQQAMGRAALRQSTPDGTLMVTAEDLRVPIQAERRGIGFVTAG